jgi:hypothetical protein
VCGCARARRAREAPVGRSSWLQHAALVPISTYLFTHTVPRMVGVAAALQCVTLLLSAAGALPLITASPTGPTAGCCGYITSIVRNASTPEVVQGVADEIVLCPKKKLYSASEPSGPCQKNEHTNGASTRSIALSSMAFATIKGACIYQFLPFLSLALSSPPFTHASQETLAAPS